MFLYGVCSSQLAVSVLGKSQICAGDFRKIYTGEI